MARRGVLNDRERLFVREYLADLNATQAAIRAGYSPKGAKVRGSLVLNRPRVRAAVEAAMAVRERALDVTAEKVVAELALMGFANITDFVVARPDGTVDVDLSKMTREQGAAIGWLAVDRGGAGKGAGEPVKIRIKLADKSRNLELLGKHLGMFGRKPGVTEEKGEDADVQLSDLELAQRLLDDAVLRGKGETDENGS